jgi:hypothetical protein
MRATFRIEDERLGVNAPEASLTAGRPLGSGDIETFEAWAATYQSLREKTGAEGQLIDLGRALYRWLDGNERWLDALLPAADPPPIFEFQALGTTGAAAISTNRCASAARRSCWSTSGWAGATSLQAGGIWR